MRACFPVGFSPLPFLALLDDPEEAAPVFPHIRPQTPLARIIPPARKKPGSKVAGKHPLNGAPQAKKNFEPL